MQEKLKQLVADAIAEINAAPKEAELMNIKSKYLGKKSEINNLMTSLKDMSVEEKKKFGSLFNQIKKELEDKIDDHLETLNNQVNFNFDPTLPITENHGSLSPITIVSKEVTDILKRMGFTIVGGPEMESEYFNFEALNIPKTHPARDMQDTYWLDNGNLLRTLSYERKKSELNKIFVNINAKYGIKLLIS